MSGKYEAVVKTVQNLEKNTFTRVAVMDALLDGSHARNFSYQMVSKQLSTMVHKGELEVVPHSHNSGTTYRKVKD